MEQIVKAANKFLHELWLLISQFWQVWKILRIKGFMNDS